ncbi:MAG TPA: YggT family protein [Gemmatimonadaceae bacterium]|jgi:YggT family protein
MEFLGAYASLVANLRVILFYMAAFVAVLCAIDWAVRTRRINPFNKIARFFRANIDPILAPIERVIVRAGGTPASAAWWGFLAFIVSGILLITLLQFIGAILFQMVGMSHDPRGAWRVIVSWILSLLSLALFVRVLSSWLPVSPYSRWIRWSYVMTDWMIRPLQSVVPRVGMFDISPIVAWILLRIIGAFLLG